MDRFSHARRLLTRQTVAAAARETLTEIAGGRLARLPLSIRFWDGSVLAAQTSSEGNGAVPPTVVARHPRALAHLLHEPGQLGLARAYIDGSLSVDGDLESVLGLRAEMTAIDLTRADRARLALAAVKAAGPSVLRHPPVPTIEAAPSVGRRHSIERDRAAVRHHYDVSNDFYRLVLGSTMVYSCAYFGEGVETLEQAQERKLDLICRKLDLRPGQHLLDIGCGWGSLVLHAAAHYGVRATGVTLSEPQAAFARERAAELGLADRLEIRVADYRELAGRHFDKIASVGMYEHVGRAELATYVRTVFELLGPGGLMLNHGIARLQSEEPDGATFINRYVFPDGELHPLADLISVMQDSGMEVRDVEALRDHYPLTLRAWIANLRGGWDEATRLVGHERTRTWDLYMLASAIAFEDADIGVYQVLAARLDAPHGLPLDRLELLAPRAETTRAA